MKNEKYIENYLTQEISKKGGWCAKFVSPGTNGMPDRIIFMPYSKIYFVETKSKTGKSSPIQKSTHRKFEAFGQKVWVVNNEETLKQFLDAI